MFKLSYSDILNPSCNTKHRKNTDIVNIQQVWFGWELAPAEKLRQSLGLLINFDKLYFAM